MNVQDIYYHGVRDQIGRVLNRMTPEQIDKGLTAFVDGASNWSSCFFARAIPGCGVADNPERFLMNVLQLPSVVPIRIVYRTFDGAGRMTKAELQKFITDMRSGDNAEESLVQLRKIDFKDVESTPVEATVVCE